MTRTQILQNPAPEQLHNNRAMANLHTMAKSHNTQVPGPVTRIDRNYQVEPLFKILSDRLYTIKKAYPASSNWAKKRSKQLNKPAMIVAAGSAVDHDSTMMISIQNDENSSSAIAKRRHDVESERNSGLSRSRGDQM